jgi:hypothetical protein
MREPPHMRAPKGKFPVWEIDTAELGEALIATAAGPSHYVVEPSREMSLDELQLHLAATRGRWVRVQ